MSIGPNGGKPIFQSWEQVQQNVQPAFGRSMSKLLTAFKDFGQKVSLQRMALLGQNMIPPAGLVNANKKIPSLFGGKGK